MSTKAISPVDELKGSIQKMDSQFKAALPPHIPVEKFTRVLMTAISQTPALAECTRPSIFAACMKAAQDGLLPDGREAAIVMFNSKAGKQAQFMPMTAGILKKVRNSGELATITAQPVYEQDIFDYYIDADGEHIKHVPNMFGDRGKRIGVYALAKTKDGAIYVEVMTEKQVMDVKNVSRSKEYGPWSGPFEEEMVKKTAIRRLSKRLPMSTDIEDTIRRDDELFMPEPTEKVVAGKTNPAQPALPQAASEPEPPAPKKTAPNKLKEAIKKEVQKMEIIEDEEPVDRPAIFAEEEGNDLDRALGEEPI
jgi:recombination protein RecT